MQKTTTLPSLENFLPRPEYSAEELARLCHLPENDIVDAARKGAFYDCVGAPGNWGFRIRRGAAIAWLQKSGLAETLVSDPWQASMARRRAELLAVAERAVAELEATAIALGIKCNWHAMAYLDGIKSLPGWVNGRIESFDVEE